jgi:hypothetical protein
MVDVLINKKFTDEELYTILKGLDMYIYENKYLNEAGYEAATSARQKIVEEIE